MSACGHDLQRTAERPQALVHAPQSKTAISDAGLDLKAHAIIADDTAQTALIPINLYADAPRACVAGCIGERFLHHAVKSGLDGGRQALCNARCRETSSCPDSSCRA